VWLGAAWLALPLPADAQTLRSYAIVGDAIPERLTTAPNGRAHAFFAIAARFRN
jgi:sulfur-oxidizing protein SoxX